MRQGLYFSELSNYQGEFQMKTTGLLRASLTAAAFLSLLGSAFGQASYFVAKSYEDTVRVAVIWNDPPGWNYCDAGTVPVGRITRDTVLSAITRVVAGGHMIDPNNIKVGRTDTMTWAKIRAMFPGKLPHTIVHVNAGWAGYDVAGGAALPNTGAWPAQYNTFLALIDSATTNKIGLVEVGDDAAYLSSGTFGFSGIQNMASPMGDARGVDYPCCADSLWVGLWRPNDDRLKTWDAANPGHLQYPGVNGIISNSVDSILRVAATPDVKLFFKDYGAGRCQEDPDVYQVQYPNWITYLGYQQGFVSNAFVPPAGTGYDQFKTIVAIQDTTYLNNNPMFPIVRRAAALSFQPQFLRNRAVEQQIIYDAVMYTSLTNMIQIATTFRIVAKDSTLRAGDTLPLKAYVIDQYGRVVADVATINRITWSLDPAFPPIDPTDKIIQVTRDSILFTGTKAYHVAHILIALSNSLVDTSIAITIVPAAPSHLVIELAGTPLPNNDNPIGSTTIGPADTTARGYAVLRDRFQNYVRYSQSTLWGSNQTLIITVPANGGGNATIGEGIFHKVGPIGSARVGAMDNGLGFKDTVVVNVSQTQYDSLAVFRVSGGTYTRIYRTDTLSLALLDSAVLVMRGHRIDNQQWELVSGNWDITAALKSLISRQPPQNSNSWTFYPTDTGRGYVNVSFQNSPSSIIKDSIHVLFKPGAANVIEIYSKTGAPGASNAAWPSDPRVADTMSADSIYKLLYAKVFNYSATTKIWLSSYETVYDSSSKIRWTVAPVDKDDSLLFATGNHTELKSTQAYRLVKVTASLGNLVPYSVLVYVTYGKPDHMVIEASATIQGAGLIDDQPLSGLVIGSNQVTGSAYAIVRDINGNFINYSTVTLWSSTDTSRFKADTGLTSVGEGVAIRRSDSGSALMIAANSTVRPGTTLRDSVPVILQNITYKKLRIYVMNGPNKVYIDTIRISTDASLVLYAEGQRSDDTTRWDPVPVQWAKTAGLKTIDAPPASFTLNWNVRPDSIGTGRISVATPDAGTFSLPAIFTEGPADQIVLYRRLGDPSRLFPFPAMDSIAAGSTDTLVGKIFDRNGTWLSRFENLSVSRDLISWTIQRVSGPPLNPGDTTDDLSAKAGHFTTFTPKIGYSTYHIVVQYKDSAKTRIDSANIYVKPGPAHHLVIEPTADITGNRLINDNPFNPDTIRFGARDNTKTAYAIIRDVYGNFVGFSTNTLWTSLNGQLVVATEGTQAIGEGLINRFPGALVGATGVSAVNRQNPNLFDAVGIVLDNVDYDSLRIVVRDNVDISSLQMRSDQDTLLQVLGKRSTDGLWVPVSGNWVYTATRGGTSISGQSAWRFKPTDTGSGTIMVSMGTSVPDMISVTILPGLPKSVVIYNSELPPGPGVVKLADPSQVITIAAGTPYLLVAKVFDNNGVWLKDYQITALQNLISWGAADPTGNLIATLDARTGAVRHFTPVKAYDTVTIIDTLRADANHMYLDTVRFAVVPGPEKRLVIEAKGPINVNRPVELDTLRILANEQSKSVYATVRDAYGNFIRYADVSIWDTIKPNIVTVQKGDNLFGEGIATRNPLATDSIAAIFAVDKKSSVTLVLADSCPVKLVKFYYTDLRIVIGTDTDPSSLVMNTNQDTTVHVQGRRSNDSVWVEVSAIWQNAANLKIVPVAPVANSWRLHPTDTGTGWIRVTLNNDGVTKPDSLPVRFTPGPPVRASIEIITPADSLIAGRPIQAVVRVYDTNGNSYSYTFDPAAGSSAAYHDTLGTGGASFPPPFIIVDGDTIRLDGSPWGSGKQTFVNGRDTVSFTLYYAPSDTAHQIYTNLSTGTKTVRAASNPFVLHPAELSEIRIEYSNGTQLPDTINLNNSMTIYSRGYDKYGNKIGDVPGIWSVTDSLHPITGPTDGSSITYDSRLAPKDESGHIVVTRNGITADIVVIIKGPPIRLVNAVTRDISGNGVLDRIELYFSRKFELPSDASFAGMKIFYNKDTLTISRILNTGTGAKDSVWIVDLTESHVDKPQTGWTPRVSLPEQHAYDLADTVITATDGAGPVVWFVESFPVAAGNHNQDTVVVTFSEPVQRHDKGSLLTSDIPSLIFYVWKQDSTGFVLVDSMFTGINTLKRDPLRGTTLTFTMSNGKDLNGNYFLSIRDSSREYVVDTTVRAVRPNLNNNPKRVVVGPGPVVIDLPVNPIGPTFKREDPGVFNVVNNPNAEKWIKDDKQGAVIKFAFPPLPPTEPNAQIACKIRIYDVIGNVVQSSDKPDFLSSGFRPDQLNNQSTVTATIYWNGSNEEGMAVAPGVYRVVVYLEYKGISAANKKLYQDKRMIAKLGVQK
jgi:hypothetical protein